MRTKTLEETIKRPFKSKFEIVRLPNKIDGYCSCCEKDVTFQFLAEWRDIKVFLTKRGLYKESQEYVYNCLSCGTTRTLYTINECSRCKE